MSDLEESPNSYEVYCPRCKDTQSFSRMRPKDSRVVATDGLLYKCRECELMVMETYAHNRNFQEALRRRNESMDRQARE